MTKRSNKQRKVLFTLLLSCIVIRKGFSMINKIHHIERIIYLKFTLSMYFCMLYFINLKYRY